MTLEVEAVHDLLRHLRLSESEAMVINRSSTDKQLVVVIFDPSACERAFSISKWRSWNVEIVKTGRILPQSIY